MANKTYVDNAIVVYDATTGTQHPGVGLVLDGTASAAVPITQISIPSVSGLYLMTLYVRIKQPATGGGTPFSTIGPVTVYFTCADCLVPVQITAGLLIQNGTIGATNSDNTQNVSLSGSVIVNALAGQPISISMGYASSGLTPTCTATCSLVSAVWNVAAIEVRGIPVYVSGNGVSQSIGATTETVIYSPTIGHATILYFATGNSITGLTVKDNLNNMLSAGPTSGLLSSFYQYPVPAGVTSYIATWVTARQSSFIVEEYSGVTAVNAGNTASGSSNTATLTVTDDENTAVTVFGFTSANTLTCTVGNQRHQVTASSARLTAADNAAAVQMTFNYHLKAVFIGSTL